MVYRSSSATLRARVRRSWGSWVPSFGQLVKVWRLPQPARTHKAFTTRVPRPVPAEATRAAVNATSAVQQKGLTSCLISALNAVSPTYGYLEATGQCVYGKFCGSKCTQRKLAFGPVGMLEHLALDHGRMA